MTCTSYATPHTQSILRRRLTSRVRTEIFMKAMVINKVGSPEVFELVDLPKPNLKDGEVLIEVKATSVNPIDYKIRDGRARDLGPAFPAILHADVSGIVVQVAKGAAFQPGDEVFGCAG